MIEQFQEVGPYVYRQKNYKYGVAFKGASVRFYDSATQQYDAHRTKSECPSCHQNDMVRHNIRPVSLNYFSDKIHSVDRFFGAKRV